MRADVHSVEKRKPDHLELDLPVVVKAPSVSAEISIWAL